MQQFITSSGLVAIFVLMVAESACIPIPSEVTMLLGGALAGGAVAGAHPNLVAVIAAGTLGNVAGSYLAWAVGRYGGRAVLLRWGRYVWLDEADIDRAQQWFTRHGVASVFFGRLLPVIRTFISLPAGFAAMRPVRFGVYTVLGCLPWTAALAGVGYGIGGNWQRVADDFHGPTYLIAGIVAVLAVVAAVVLMRRRRSRPATSEPSAAPADPGLR
ncbi:membrane protein DedA with SNARE-associated domain [Nocardia sp. GAS34]|uniref:DedA family protein n=1 Tax=unclassified Nocardia TaxID=2637762 RepID=UPI003D224EBE